MSDALRLEDVSVDYTVGGKARTVLKGLSLSIAPGEAYGLVGESGCGKSTAALAAVRYLARNGKVSAGRILIDGRDLMGLSASDLRGLRSRTVAMVYQDPGRALNPSLKIARQMTEVFEVAEGLRGQAAEARALEMLARVQIANPARVMGAYPHELSGGMQQRVVIAMALSINPKLLILDEPTTGLDATVEAEILDLIVALRRDYATAILMISHSLSVIAHVCDRVGVLYAGELVEEGPAAEIFAQARHPYTVALLRCLPERGRLKSQGPLETIPGFLPAPGAIQDGCVYAPRCPIARDRCRAERPPLYDLGGRVSRCHYWEAAPAIPRQTVAFAAARPVSQVLPVLKVRDLSKTYTVDGKAFQASRDISLDLWAGETLGLVGESGSGKSTLAKLLLGLAAPDAGSTIEMEGEALPPRAKTRSRAQLKALQMVFQNPGLALNRSHSVRRLIDRAMRLTGALPARREEKLAVLAHEVRLTGPQLDEKPRRLSGGLKQRVGIARAFASEPQIVVCDEPTSALDVSVQAAILNLLVDLQAKQQVSYIFISHDLGVVNYLADRVAVLFLGRVLETGPTRAVFAAPHHPYTEALVSASPAISREGVARIRLHGEIPSAAAPPPGCVFNTRCPRKIGPICETEAPPARDAGAGHVIACHIPVAELAILQSSSSGAA
ncbi:MAG: ABC transporter ATP-binding protein [Sphingomonas sp. 32-66-10]|nr:MAG: ABC transporter ATP-binding protein [Sphingomonas sp. 32-66-10]